MPGCNDVVYKGSVDHVVRNFSLLARAFDDDAQQLMESDYSSIFSHVLDAAEQEHQVSQHGFRIRGVQS